MFDNHIPENPEEHRRIIAAKRYFLREKRRKDENDALMNPIRQEVKNQDYADFMQEPINFKEPKKVVEEREKRKRQNKAKALLAAAGTLLCVCVVGGGLLLNKPKPVIVPTEMSTSTFTLVPATDTPLPTLTPETTPSNPPPEFGVIDGVFTTIVLAGIGSIIAVNVRSWIQAGKKTEEPKEEE